MEIEQFTAENNRRILLAEENQDLLLRIDEAKDSELFDEVERLQELIDENNIAIAQISVEICDEIGEADAKRRKEHREEKTLGESREESRNIGMFLDSLLHTAISGAFRFAVFAADDPAKYDLKDEKLPPEMMGHREAFAWIEEDDDE